jgi:predicted O-linked N-acetylglucosamine transferase (SPINDLY family)
MDFATRHRRGIQYAQQNRFEEACVELAAAVRLSPRDLGAWINYGNILTLLGRSTDALAAYDQALAIRNDPDAWNNRGNALQALGRHAEAIASYDRAPHHGDAQFNRGNALAALARFRDALAGYDRVLAARPGHAQAWFRRGIVLAAMNRSDDAIASYDRALALAPDHVEALNNRGYLWWGKYQYAPALADLEKAFALDPALPWLEGGIAHLKMYVAEWSDFAARKARLEDGVRQGRKVARPFMFQALCDDPALLQACSRLFTASEYPPLASPPHDKRIRDKIRIGYVSGEFREQATAILMAGLYEKHDRSRFDITAINNGGPDQSVLRRRLEKAFDHWIDISSLNDQDAAAAVRAAGIDILVNLNGYFGKPRMGLFARRPAPIQVNYLGFPATLGAPYIDYLMADAVVIPPDAHRFYDEKIVTLPGCYQVNDDRGRPMAPAPGRVEAGLPPTGFVFCNFNQSYKLTPDVFAGWMRILGQVPGSVLWLLNAPSPYAANLRRHAEAAGVDGARIIFAPDRAPADHLARLSLADLFLDGLPYNAHTTASDALWAGVPLLTRRGTSFPGRVAASLLAAAGLPQLIAQTQEEYEALAVRLARDPATLPRPRRDCPLFDTDATRRHIEAAYHQIWERWQAGEPPAAFTVTA